MTKKPEKATAIEPSIDPNDFDPRPPRQRPFDKSTTHPSYGMINFSRGQWSGGGARLFGSPLESHSTTISMTVKRAEISHEMNRDWFYGRETLIEVMMSPMQFSELLTTLNVGEGVPCTITYAEGERVKPDERVSTERQRAVDSFKEDMQAFGTRLDKMRKAVKATLDQKGPLKAADKVNVAHAVDMLVQEVYSNIPFALAQFNEATDKITTAAKADVDAFVTTAVSVLGFEKLEELKRALALASAPSTVAALPHEHRPGVDDPNEPEEDGKHLRSDGSAK